MTTTSPDRRRSPARRGQARLPAFAGITAAAAWACVAAAGCAEPVEQSEACRVYLDCFFKDGMSQYPEGTWDGGTIPASTISEDEPFELEYSGFATPEAQQALRDAYGKDGICWRKKIDPFTPQDDLNAVVHAECTKACAMALAADCERHRVWTETDGGVGPPPACLDPALRDDKLENHEGTKLTCDEVRVMADGGTVP